MFNLVYYFIFNYAIYWTVTVEALLFWCCDPILIINYNSKNVIFLF